MYVPAFFEVFVGLVVLMVWTRFVLNRGAHPAIRWVPWIVGAILVIGQGVAAVVLMQGMGSPALADTQTVRTAQVVSGIALVVGSIVLVGATAWTLLTARPSS